ncbi:hypothetical protein F442_22460 [Phytophthora nicotianae P10297]|uniref:PiggyBac transposable element-derived protein domain-containing protein n=1 Tax=Phytophthora nicotianae P10297 TaxID=1317064 RepID=W2Y0K6_PHYNI|nr:hypothetical protein F442_22460 [Phytophthora nicotianae P10297]
MPVRTSKRTKAQAEALSTIDVRDVDFGHLWRQLVRVGWTSKRPTRLSNLHSYYSPNATKEPRVEGVNMFIGEHAVVLYALEQGIIGAEERSASEDKEGQSEDDEPDDPAVCERVTASQIDTTVALSANTVDALFGSESEERDESTECPLCATSPHIEDENTRLSQIDTSIALSANTIDAIFGGEDPDASPCVGQNDAGEPVTPTSTRRRDTVTGAVARINSGVFCGSVQGDVNIMKDEDNADEYESMDSESDGCGSDDDGDVVFRQVDNDLSSDEEEAPLMDAAFIDCLGGSLSIEYMSPDTVRSMAWTPVSSEYETDSNAFKGMRNQEARPVEALRAKKDSQLELLFYFMPTNLWTIITSETNRYKRSHLEEKARQERARLIREGRSVPGQSLRDVRRRIRVEPDYVPREVLCVMGLFVAHMLSPTRPFLDHWAMADDGALSAGRFGNFIPRNRCTSILRDLHFCNNDTANKRDKLWKLGAVVDVLQRKFLSAWSVTNIISFDEGVLPATFKRNGTRMFMPDKLHRYGIKMFMTCDAVSAYCHRFEIYVGKRQNHESASQAFDHKTGAAAVIRNLKAVLDENDSGFRIIIVDRFYTSLALAIQLLSMSIYTIGTIMTSRLGFDKNVVERRKTRPATVERGSFKFSRSVAVPTMVACHWWDRKPVHYLATRVSMTEDSIKRNLKAVGQATFGCPKLVTDY